MNDSAFIESIAGPYREWNEAETWVKKGENINGAPVIPAINELRYAGRRLVDALAAHQQEDSGKAKNPIKAAKDNLSKTKHDVVDSLFSFYFDSAGLIRQKRDTLISAYL